MYDWNYEFVEITTIVASVCVCVLFFQDYRLFLGGWVKVIRSNRNNESQRIKLMIEWCFFLHFNRYEELAQCQMSLIQKHKNERKPNK